MINENNAIKSGYNIYWITGSIPIYLEEMIMACSADLPGDLVNVNKALLFKTISDEIFIDQLYNIAWYK